MALRLGYSFAMSPRASVIIPVYNRAHSVLPALQSVQNQTMPDFECIVVDDGSRDGDALRQVVDGLRDKRFRYVRRENGGGGAARNTGIDEARADVVAFLDSDDRWLPEKLKQDFEAGADRQVVFSGVQVERGGRIIGLRPKAVLGSTELMGDYLARRQGFVQTSTIALPRQVAKQVRFLESLPFGQDADFAIRVAAAGARVFMQSRALVIMQDDEDQSRVSRSRDWRAVLQWLENVRPLLSNRAYHAMRGWHAARIAADAGEYATAFRLYAAALIKGAFPPSLAVKALGQILLRRTVLSTAARAVRNH